MNRARGAGILTTILLGSGLVLASQDAARAEGKIHLVIVADTLDPKIGPSVRTSVEQVETAFRLGVPEATGILHVERIEGERCRREVILSRIAAMEIGPDDALLVFYAGHGAYDPRIDQYLKFPRLNADGYLARSDLIGAIRARRPRLGLVATDCCNKMSVIPRKAFPQAPSMAAPFPERPRVRLLFQALFLDAAGFVDLTSSKRGEESIGYPASRWEEGGPLYSRGGLFSTAFTAVLRQYQDRVLTWDSVSQKTAEAVGQAFRALKPNGLDNPDEPENPQMTQTVVASIDVRMLRQPVDPDADGGGGDLPVRPLDGGPWRARGALGVHGLENGGRGIAVYAVQPNSPAARLGLEQGDVILSINDTTIRTAFGYARSMWNCEGAAELVFRDVRTGQIRTATVELEDRGFVPPGREPPEGRSVFGASGVAVAEGIRIDGTKPGSPAALSGLEPGDVITAINDEPVRTIDEYFSAVRGSPVEMAYTLLNTRTGRPQGMVCTLDRPAAPTPNPIPNPNPNPPGARNWTVGIYGYDNANGGLFIWATRPGSPAARLGFEQGDLILTVDGRRIDRVEDYQRAVAASGGQIELTFRNVRTGQVQRASARLDERLGPPADHGRQGIFGAYGTEIPGVGVRVDGCYPGSAAHLAGVDPGDVIVSVNGIPVRSNADYFRAVHESPDEMIFTVHNVRTGRPLGMVVTLDR